jgi:hypothetical protein
VGGAAFEDADVAVVTQLTQLEHLSVSSARKFTDVGLEQLIGLQLRSLSVHSCGLSIELTNGHSGDSIYLGRGWITDEVRPAKQLMLLACAGRLGC